MGYIIPYTHYTYQQYARRMEKKKDRPHHVDRPYRAVFHEIKEDYPYDRYKHIYKVKKKHHVKKRSFNIEEAERFLLTGKGGIFNEFV
ncbi:hypothetical protein [Pseudogracilibacillus sp. ICA-222130]|uniref:hypothetical protein n=1 Tax=Pseudogracilibacillus sp. ICA-222130 TaxID=3134655 RepID=UPI0030C2B618